MTTRITYHSPPPAVDLPPWASPTSKYFSPNDTPGVLPDPAKAAILQTTPTPVRKSTLERQEEYAFFVQQHAQWEKETSRSLRRMDFYRILVLFAGVSIIVCAILLSIFGYVAS